MTLSSLILWVVCITVFGLFFGYLIALPAIFLINFKERKAKNKMIDWINKEINRND